jgi:feruloyl esterase
MTTKQHLLRVFFLLAAFSGCSERAARPTCEDLAQLALPDTTITLARSVAAGAFVPPREFPFPGGAPPKDFIPYTTLPAFCRVSGSIKPVPDSYIEFEVWMPSEGWNGKLVGVGNGGVKAKAIVAERYGEGARRSYWLGCSTGGRQGLMEAQRFPEDYDGISAGAPANNWVPLMASGTWIVAALEDPSGGIPAEKFPAIQRAAVDACDEKDGVPDRVIGEPAKCDFDPGVLLCNGADGPDCLTSAQVDSMRKIYAGPKNPRTGEQVFPGVEPGSELELPAFFRFRIYEKYFRQLVLENPEWDLRTLDYDRDLAAARERHDAILKATDPDLSVFVDRGGKLFLWHGWNDTLIAPRNTIHYYEEVLRTMGADRVKDSVRLFMLPGVLHCSGGDGADNVDHLSVLEGWVELGKAPDHVIARKRLDESGERTRPLCPHPQVARYAGTGNVEDDASYRCSDD